ncbi:MAG TPA: hypothetical protein VN853_02600, partial [Polyangia bacterium]|nr:hypothetical protein [Polyangia bacterium]
MSARLLAGLALALAMTSRPAAAQTARDAGTADAAEAGEVIPDGAPPDAATASVPPAAAATPAVVVPVVVPVLGRVLEKGTRQPLAGAVIAIDGASTGETDAAGRFRIGVAAGRHDLSIKVAGEEMIHQEIEARAETAAEEQ